MNTVPKAQTDIPTRVSWAVAAAQDRQAIDLKVLRIAEVSDFTSFFLICSGASNRQVQAIVDGVVGKLRPEKIRPLHVEGYDNAAWVLLDYGDFVVHVFDEQTREYYSLERLWNDAPDVTAECSV